MVRWGGGPSTGPAIRTSGACPLGGSQPVGIIASPPLDSILEVPAWWGLRQIWPKMKHIHHDCTAFEHEAI